MTLIAQRLTSHIGGSSLYRAWAAESFGRIGAVCVGPAGLLQSLLRISLLPKLIRTAKSCEKSDWFCNGIPVSG